MSTLQIELLGGLRLTYNAQPVTTVHAPRLQEMLAYLLLQRTSPQPRARLAAIFWPEAKSESQARTNLRNLHNLLRKALPAIDDFVHADGDMLQWNLQAPFTLDLIHFAEARHRAEEAYHQGELDRAQHILQEAVDRFGGDLLPECDGDWIRQHRHQARQDYLLALTRLAHIAEERGDYAVAVTCAQRIADSEEMYSDEAAHRRLLRLYAAQGDLHKIHEGYAQLTARLDDEMGIEPGHETQLLYQKLTSVHNNGSAPGLLTASSSAQPHPEGGWALVGRQSEWWEVMLAWRKAAAGAAQLVMVSGEAGVGKSRLAEELMGWARRQNIVTLDARLYPEGAGLAYAPVIDWLRSDRFAPALAQLDRTLLTELARILPELVTEYDLPEPVPMSGPWQRKHLFAALAAALLTLPQPLILWLDDLPHCDQETLDWLAYLLHQHTNARLLIVATARDEEMVADHPIQQLLLNLAGRRILTPIQLRPLNEAETAELSTRVAKQTLSADTLSRLYRETEGNPLFVVEVIRSGLSTDMPGQPPHINLPSSVKAVIHYRLAQLTPDERAVVELAACIGREFSFDVLVAAGEFHETTLIGVLERLLQRQIIREQGEDGYNFSHDKLREGVYQQMSAVRRRISHRRIAEALLTLYGENADSVHGRLAWHYAQAGMLRQAIDAYQQAAHVAVRTMAFHQTVDHLERARALTGKLPAGPQRDEMELGVLLQYLPIMTTIFGYGAQCVGDALHRAIPLCQQRGVLAWIPYLEGMLWGHHHLRAEHENAMATANRIARTVETEPIPELILAKHIAYGGTYQFQGQLAAALRHLQESHEIYVPERDHQMALRLGMDIGLIGLGYLAQTNVISGRFLEAKAAAERMLTLGRQLDHPYYHAYACTMISIVYQCAGDVKGVLALTAEGLPIAINTGFLQLINQMQITQGWAWAQQGNAIAGLDQLRRAIDAWRGSGDLGCTYYYALLADACAGMERYAEGLDAVDEGFAISRRNGEPWIDAELHRLRGEILLKQSSDNQHEAQICFLLATELAQKQEARLFELRAAVDLARLWRQQGKYRDALTWLRPLYTAFGDQVDVRDLSEAALLLTNIAQETQWNEVMSFD